MHTFLFEHEIWAECTKNDQIFKSENIQKIQKMLIEQTSETLNVKHKDQFEETMLLLRNSWTHIFSLPYEI